MPNDLQNARAWFLVRREGAFARLGTGKALAVVAVEGNWLRRREATEEEAERLDVPAG